MEPKTQVEIQLGHMCNNRCVFCVSGQETELGRARPMAAEPILRSLTAAFAAGHRKVTLLGGEPTLQPAFREVALHAIGLGFEEIVIFTNGVKTARRSFIEDVLETGGNFTWRISIQGATEEAHERTTRRSGSFGRIVRSMGHLRDLGQRMTINMCVVRSNFESVGRFPELLARFGASQLHLDMIRPMDAGARTEAEYRAMIPRYSDLVPALEELVAGTPPGFDLNIGNLPYCIAPHLARFIHHDGETTYTVAVDGNALSDPWDKYAVKRRDKSKPASCAACAFDARCNGVFDKYREIYGVSEFVPVPATAVAGAASGRGISERLASVFHELAAWSPPAPFTGTSIDVLDDREVSVTLTGVAPLRVVVRRPGAGAASFDAFGVSVASLPQDRKTALLGLSALWARLAEFGFRVWHPLGGDAIRGGVTPRIAKRLARLRSTAPHGDAQWRSLACDPDGSRVELELVSEEGERATFWIADGGGGVRAGYDVGGRTPGPALVGTLRAMMSALTERLPIVEPRAENGARP